MLLQNRSLFFADGMVNNRGARVEKSETLRRIEHTNLSTNVSLTEFRLIMTHLLTYSIVIKLCGLTKGLQVRIKKLSVLVGLLTMNS